MKINNIVFDLYSYYKFDTRLYVTVTNTTFSDIEEAVGNSAVVEIDEEYKAYNLTLISCARNNGMIDVVFIDQDLVASINSIQSDVVSLQSATDQNTGDIEANAEAIVELAEMIGGAE